MKAIFITTDANTTMGEIDTDDLFENHKLHCLTSKYQLKISVKPMIYFQNQNVLLIILEADFLTVLLLVIVLLVVMMVMKLSHFLKNRWINITNFWYFFPLNQKKCKS